LPKNGLKSSHKTITISILKPIAAGLSKEEFINNLQKKIYEELDLLN
jgi:1-acyl-sn-glycerol-3-phosphate acyltransferase